MFWLGGPARLGSTVGPLSWRVRVPARLLCPFWTAALLLVLRESCLALQPSSPLAATGRPRCSEGQLLACVFFQTVTAILLHFFSLSKTRKRSCGSVFFSTELVSRPSILPTLISLMIVALPKGTNSNEDIVVPPAKRLNTGLAAQSAHHTRPKVTGTPLHPRQRLPS